LDEAPGPPRVEPARADFGLPPRTLIPSDQLAAAQDADDSLAPSVPFTPKPAIMATATELAETTFAEPDVGDSWPAKLAARNELVSLMAEQGMLLSEFALLGLLDPNAWLVLTGFPVALGDGLGGFVGPLFSKVQSSRLWRFRAREACRPSHV
jgi:hypothetical protein